MSYFEVKDKTLNLVGIKFNYRKNVTSQGFSLYQW